MWLTTAAQGAVITNASFEAPVVPNGSFAEPNPLLGWTTLDQPVQLFNTNYVESISGTTVHFNAQSGTQWVDLSGRSNLLTDGLSQAVATVPGQSYLLSFYVGRADAFDPTSAIVDLSINGGARTHFTNSDLTAGHINWKQFTVGFTAASASTTLSFLSGLATGAGFVAGLDNVTLAEVPEPATLGIWSLLFGLVGLTWARRARSGGPRRR